LISPLLLAGGSLFGHAGTVAHSRRGLLTMPVGNHLGKRMGKGAYFIHAVRMAYPQTLVKKLFAT
jgi:hypothetical protein